MLLSFQEAAKASCPVKSDDVDSYRFVEVDWRFQLLFFFSLSPSVSQISLSFPTPYLFFSLDCRTIKCCIFLQ